MSEAANGICEVEYDIGNRYRVTQLVRCRHKATQIINGQHVCARHAPRLLKLQARADAALDAFFQAADLPRAPNGER